VTKYVGRGLSALHLSSKDEGEGDREINSNSNNYKLQLQIGKISSE
jgi:hypothetical protein